jgi:hypothetical protein
MEENKNVENVEETTENNEQKEENVEETTENKEGENKEETKEKEPNKVVAWFKNTWNTIYNKLGLKKLLIISYIALGVIVIALIISVSVVGAKNGDLKKKSANSSATTSYSSKDEELFSTWKQGIFSTMNYEPREYKCTGSQTVDVKKGNTTVQDGHADYNEVILLDGQYAYECKSSSTIYNTDGSTKSESDNPYTVIKYDDGKFYYWADDFNYYRLVDTEYYKTIGLNTYLSTSENPFAYIAVDADKLENVSKNVLAYYSITGIGMTQCSAKISKDGDVITLEFDYTINEIDDDCFMTTNCIESYTVKDNMLSKFYLKYVVNEDYINSVDTISTSEKTMTYTYASSDADFASIASDKTMPAQVTDLDVSVAVEYYIDGARYENNGDVEIGSTVTSFPDEIYFDWYTDEALHINNKYNNETVPSTGMKLYALEKENHENPYSTLVVFINNISYKYPDVVPTSLREDNDEKTCSIVDFTDASLVYSTVLTKFSSYTGKFKINNGNEEYTLSDLANYTFERGNVYYINYYTSRNGMYA